MIYLDNAATTYPKPEEVYKKIDWANRNIAVNAGRGSYKVAQEASQLIENTRRLIIELVHGVGIERTVLLPSATIALNVILNGLSFSNGDIIYVSPYEHNAVARTLNRISNIKNVHIEELPLKENLEIDIDKVRYLFMKNKPKCVCCTHVSNVTGYILPVKEIFEEAKEYGAITVMDASQSLGVIDIDVKTYKADFIAFAGHKTLYGPFGVAGFIYNSAVPLESFIVGGTGSESLNLDMPKQVPEKYEPASKNIVAIAGLNEALTVLDRCNNYQKEKALSGYAIEKLAKMKNVILYVPENKEQHIGVISFNVKGYKSDDIGTILDEDFDIAVRTGYHCAPYIHKYLDDEKYLGTVRVGLGQYNTKTDIDQLVDAISEL
jgi:cysteine desulfurase family protein